jgi:hypothetical protein
MGQASHGMNEKLLQFIWQFRYFRADVLLTTQGDILKILYQGQLNTNQGPDFMEGIIYLNHTQWAGNIELHVLSSDWYKHGHQSDQRYLNIILHVVWIDDKPVYDGLGNPIPTLELNGLVARSLLDKYTRLMHSEDLLPCKTWLPSIKELIWVSWKERLAIERLCNKSNYFKAQLTNSNNNWDWVLWQMIARVFGGKVNGTVFELVFQSIPFGVLQRCSHQPLQIEALLMGQSGLLEDVFTDEYPKQLQQEYAHLKNKFKLPKLKQKVAFLRMRPAGFPTIRLSQLSSLIIKHPSLYETIKSIKEIAQLSQLFSTEVRPYWNNHYKFDEESSVLNKQTGVQLQQTILINALVPFLYTYGLIRKNQEYIDRAIQILYHLPPEQNNILKKWQELPVTHNCALHSQALLQLQHEFCDKKACLNCAIGNVILR